MKNLYYSIWVDAILRIKENPLRKEDWKWMSQIIIATFMSLNIVFFQFVLITLGVLDKFFMLDINWFKVEKLNNLISYFTLYILPFLLLNYVLIFHKYKYKELIKIYPYKEGKWIANYVYFSAGSVLLYIFVTFLWVMYQS